MSDLHGLYLEDLFVDAAARGLGLGKALIVAGIAVDKAFIRRVISSRALQNVLAFCSSTADVAAFRTVGAHTSADARQAPVRRLLREQERWAVATAAGMAMRRARTAARTNSKASAAKTDT
jgi:GNAT superfamily N-acetyltransferase